MTRAIANALTPRDLADLWAPHLERVPPVHAVRKALGLLLAPERRATAHVQRVWREFNSYSLERRLAIDRELEKHEDCPPPALLQERALLRVTTKAFHATFLEIIPEIIPVTYGPAR